MHRLISLIVIGAILSQYCSGMPQELSGRDQDEQVDSRYYSGYNNGYYPSSWSSWSSSGYPQQISYNNGYGSNGGYYSGNSYGNSYNKAGSCPAYGRRRRSPEADTEIEGANPRYYSNGNYYGSSSSTYYCNNDHDCSGNLKCCYSYGQRQCTYPHYNGGLGITSSGIGIGLRSKQESQEE